MMVENEDLYSFSRYHCIGVYYLYLEFEFKNVATPVCFPLRRLIRKVSRTKGSPSLQILEYSITHPKIKTQIWISNFVGAKLSCWHLGILPFFANLYLPWDWIFQDILLGILFCFSLLRFTMLLLSWGTTWMVKWWNEYFPVGGLLCFSFLGEIHSVCSLVFTVLW